MRKGLGGRKKNKGGPDYYWPGTLVYEWIRDTKGKWGILGFLASFHKPISV